MLDEFVISLIVLYIVEFISDFDILHFLMISLIVSLSNLLLCITLYDIFERRLIRRVHFVVFVLCGILTVLGARMMVYVSHMFQRHFLFGCTTNIFREIPCADLSVFLRR